MSARGYLPPLLIQKDYINIRCAYITPLPGSMPPVPPGPMPTVNIVGSGAGYGGVQCGIQTMGRHNISVQGPVWKSVIVTGWPGGGVNVNPGSSGVTLQNMEITGNGPTNGASSGGGLILSGAGTICSQLVVHDNRNTNILVQQNISSGINTASLTRCLIANYSPALNPIYYVQPDGLRLQSTSNSNIQIQSCIFGPGLNNGVATLNCFNSTTSLNGCLFINSIQSDLTKSPLVLSYNNNNFRLSNIISFQTPLNIRNQANANLNYPVTPLDSVSQSYFYGGSVSVMSSGPIVPQQRNLQYKTSGNTAYLSPVQTPFQFRGVMGSIPNNAPPPVLMNLDYTPTNPINLTPTSITSVQQLFSRNIVN